MMKFGVIHRDNIRALSEACGRNPEQLGRFVEQRLKLPVTDPKHLRPDNFSLREMAEGLGGDVRPFSDGPVFREAVSASQFNTLVGTLLSTKVMDAYEPFTKIVDQLVTQFTSTQETDKVPGGYIAGSLMDVGEGAEYPHTGDIKEKYVEIGHQKRGLILDVIDEAVRFDRTGIVMREAVKLGERMGRDRESRIMSLLQDLTGYKAWYPSGSQEDLYANAAASTNHTYDNLVTDALADYTDVNALWILLRKMKDENGDPINVMPDTLLVPVTLQITASRVVMNEVLAGGTNTERNPLQWVLPSGFKVLAHPDLDAQSTTAWYLGDFKKQFVEKVVIPPQVVSRRYGDNNEDAWRNDIVASYKVRYDSKVGAVDYVFVGKSTGAG